MVAGRANVTTAPLYTASTSGDHFSWRQRNRRAAAQWTSNMFLIAAYALSLPRSGETTAAGKAFSILHNGRWRRVLWIAVYVAGGEEAAAANFFITTGGRKAGRMTAKTGWKRREGLKRRRAGGGCGGGRMAAQRTSAWRVVRISVAKMPAVALSLAAFSLSDAASIERRQAARIAAAS